MNEARHTLYRTSALVRPSLAFGFTIGLTLSVLAGPLEQAYAHTTDAERSGQDNISFEGVSDGEIDRLIRQFGPTSVLK